MIEERILITVKTYPTPSSHYHETVCTAGITEAGEWRRLYPIRFRYLAGDKQYKLYDRIAIKTESISKDGRPESRKPQCETIRILDHVREWKNRHQWVGPTLFPSLSAMIDAGRSIGPVRVDRVLEFIAKPIDPTWSKADQERMNQHGLFENNKPLEKIPFEFRFRWKDCDGQEYNSMFIAWEVFQTWRKYRHNYEQPIDVMRDKWMNDICSKQRELAFFMGNSAAHRQVFMVCGIYNPPGTEATGNDTLWQANKKKSF